MQKNGYKELIVWQKALKLASEVYRLTAKFPKEEIYGLSSQMKRAAVSIPSNIAEGSRRTSKDFQRFLTFSYSSDSELETQIEIAKDLGFSEKQNYLSVENLLEEVMRMLNKMIIRIK